MRTSIIHVSSKNRTRGEIDNFEISFKNAQLFLENFNGKIILEPIQVCLNRSWYSVEAPNNTWELQTNDDEFVQYTIPPGNYNVKTFMRYLQNLLTDWLIGWRLETNKYEYFPPNDGNVYRFRFNNYSAYLFGFRPDDIVEASIPNNSPLVSTHTINMSRANVVFLHTDLVKRKWSAVDNLTTSQMEESTVMLKIPVNCPPWDSLIWRANARDIVSFELSSQVVNTMRIWVTDQDNQPLALNQDYTLSFKITYYESTKDDDMIKMIQNLESYVHYLVLNTISPDTNKMSK
jgi:hypothetical protein